MIGYVQDLARMALLCRDRGRIEDAEVVAALGDLDGVVDGHAAKRLRGSRSWARRPRLPVITVAWPRPTVQARGLPPKLDPAVMVR